MEFRKHLVDSPFPMSNPLLEFVVGVCHLFCEGRDLAQLGNAIDWRLAA